MPGQNMELNDFDFRRFMAVASGELTEEEAARYYGDKKVRNLDDVLDDWE